MDLPRGKSRLGNVTKLKLIFKKYDLDFKHSILKLIHTNYKILRLLKYLKL